MSESEFPDSSLPLGGGSRGYFHFIGRMFAGPFFLYLACFVLLTFPLITRFNSAYFTDCLDGYQTIWDLWWVRYSLLDLHQNPFFTQYLSYPHGTSLLLHTLIPFLGLLSIPLDHVMGEIQGFNTIVILAFVGSGLSAFWLCWMVTRSYWPSMAGGFAFAFCSFRWAHYLGHLHTISSEAMPLYIAGLLCLLSRPRVLTAMGMALSLLIMLLCDQYLPIYCALVTVVVLLWWGVKWVRTVRADRPPVTRLFIALAVFLFASALTSGPLVWATMREARSSPPAVAHDPEIFSADMLAPWVPDWTWVYNDLTRAIWVPMLGHWKLEKGLCLGPAIVIAALFAFFPRNNVPRLVMGSTGLFAVLGIVFLCISFGPTWRFWTIPVTRITPYRALVWLFPSIGLGGSISRFIIVAQLAVSVLASAGLARLVHMRSKSRRALVIVLFVGVMMIESQPIVMLTCPPDVPRWVEVLRDTPGHGAVLDLLEADEQTGFYYQTIHRHPINISCVFRISVAAVASADAVIAASDRGDFRLLANMGFVYVVTLPNGPMLNLPVIYSDRTARIYKLPPA